MAKFGFDLDEVEIDVQQDYRPFPKGNYKLQAVEAEEKETAKRNGTYIKVKFEVAMTIAASKMVAAPTLASGARTYLDMQLS